MKSLTIIFAAIVIGTFPPIAGAQVAPVSPLDACVASCDQAHQRRVDLCPKSARTRGRPADSDEQANKLKTIKQCREPIHAENAQCKVRCGVK